jgi:hypothetical protein
MHHVLHGDGYRQAVLMPITGFVSSCLGIAIPSGFNQSTLVWVNAVTANGGTVSAGRETLVDNLIVGLKADGVWTKLDRLWILAAENEPSALTDLVALTLSVTHGSPSFAANLGYTGIDTSTTVYIDTGTNLSTFGGLYSTNVGHISVWSNTDITGSGLGRPMGVTSTASTNRTLIGLTSITVNFSANESSGSAPITTVDSLGHYLVNRDSASTEQGYKNGSLIGNPNGVAGTIPSINIILLADNDVAVGVTRGSEHQITMASLGGNLSSTDVSNFYNRLRTYMTAVGVP